jgi:hypothetical protein
MRKVLRNILYWASGAIFCYLTYNRSRLDEWCSDCGAYGLPALYLYLLNSSYNLLIKGRKICG